jgi:hypothetical protein
VIPAILDLEARTEPEMADTAGTRPELKRSRPEFAGNWTEIGGLRPENDITNNHLDEGEREGERECDIIHGKLLIVVRDSFVGMSKENSNPNPNTNPNPR